MKSRLAIQLARERVVPARRERGFKARDFQQRPMLQEPRFPGIDLIDDRTRKERLHFSLVRSRAWSLLHVERFVS